MENKINFTKAIIDTLPIPEPGKRDTYHDKETSGLQLRITSTGVKTFSVYRRIKSGNPERITLGRYPDMKIEQARREALRIAVDISDGKNPAEIKRGRKEELTFSELFDEYLERHAKPKKKTWF